MLRKKGKRIDIVESEIVHPKVKNERKGMPRVAEGIQRLTISNMSLVPILGSGKSGQLGRLRGSI